MSTEFLACREFSEEKGDRKGSLPVFDSSTSISAASASSSAAVFSFDSSEPGGELMSSFTLSSDFVLFPVRRHRTQHK